MSKPTKAVVVFSGGQDSTTCLFWAKQKYEEVIAVSFDYGQRHVKELECAKAICKKHGIEHHIMDMGLLGQLAPNSLTRTDMDSLGDIAEALAECGCLGACDFLRRVQSEVTKIVEYQEER